MKQITKLTKRDARKVLSVVDQGLTSGLGKPEPGKLCVEAAICLALGYEHSDEPACVAPLIRRYKFALTMLRGLLMTRGHKGCGERR